MKHTVRAVYEDGIFRPLQAVRAAEGTEVEVVISTPSERPAHGTEEADVAHVPQVSEEREPYLHGASCQTATANEYEMRKELNIVMQEGDNGYYWGWCLEVPGANGQGKTLEDCREDICEATKLLLQVRREDGLRGVPPEAIRETVLVE